MILSTDSTIFSSTLLPPFYSLPSPLLLSLSLSTLGSYCVYCPENGDLPCQKADNFDNENDCNGGVACELPDGSVVFTLTEEECRFLVISLRE